MSQRFTRVRDNFRVVSTMGLSRKLIATVKIHFHEGRLRRVVVINYFRGTSLLANQAKSQFVKCW